MAYLAVSNADSVRILSLNRPKANALNSAFLTEIGDAVHKAATEPQVCGVILASSVPRFFSAGFDTNEIFPLGAAEIRAFFGKFLDLTHAFLNFPKPVVAAIPGHAMAGGAVLALACDARVMAEGHYGFALNEINLGIVLSPGVIRMATAAIGMNASRSLVLEGNTISPQQALAMGLASELALDGQLIERALAKAHALASKPPEAFAAVKRLIAGQARLSLAEDHASLDRFTHHWCSEESTRLRQALADKLKGRE